MRPRPSYVPRRARVGHRDAPVGHVLARREPAAACDAREARMQRSRRAAREQTQAPATASVSTQLPHPTSHTALATAASIQRAAHPPYPTRYAALATAASSSTRHEAARGNQEQRSPIKSSAALGTYSTFPQPPPWSFSLSVIGVPRFQKKNRKNLYAKAIVGDEKGHNFADKNQGKKKKKWVSRISKNDFYSWSKNRNGSLKTLCTFWTTPLR